LQQIQTEKFSDVSVLVRSLLPLERRTITAYNLLVFMLKSKTADFDSKQKLSIALNHAYGMKVSYGLTGYGRQVALDIRFQYIRPERVKDPDYIHEVVHMMDQILHHALFDQKSFEEAKYLLASRLRRQNDDPDSLALKTAFALAAEDHDIAIPIQGALEDIEALSYEEVVALYESWRALPRFVSCCGTLEPVMEAFLNAIPQFEKPSLRMALIPRTSPSFQVLEKNIAQTSIVQVWATSTPIDSSRYYPLLVLNSILGQGPMSLLFEEVREKNSLCYSISSSLVRFDGALLISTGTSADSIARCLRLIQAQIQKCADGQFSDEQLEIAKMDLIDMFRRQQDRPWAMIEQLFLDSMLERSESLAQRVETIRTIERDQVCEVASRLALVSMAIVKEDFDETMEN